MSTPPEAEGPAVGTEPTPRTVGDNVIEALKKAGCSWDDTQAIRDIFEGPGGFLVARTDVVYRVAEAGAQGIMKAVHVEKGLTPGEMQLAAQLCALRVAQLASASLAQRRGPTVVLLNVGGGTGP